MAEAARQVATLAVLISQHVVVIHPAVVALQQEEPKRRQQQQFQSFVRIRLVGKVKTNASKSLQMSYDHYKCLAINKNGLRLLTKMLWKQWEYMYAFLANFRSMFPNVRNTPWTTANVYEHIRMPVDHLVIIANWWRIAFVRPFATIIAIVWDQYMFKIGDVRKTTMPYQTALGPFRHIFQARFDPRSCRGTY